MSESDCHMEPEIQAAGYVRDLGGLWGGWVYVLGRPDGERGRIYP